MWFSVITGVITENHNLGLSDQPRSSTSAQQSSLMVAAVADAAPLQGRREPSEHGRRLLWAPRGRRLATTGSAQTTGQLSMTAAANFRTSAVLAHMGAGCDCDGQRQASTQIVRTPSETLSGSTMAASTSCPSRRAGSVTGLDERRRRTALVDAGDESRGGAGRVSHSGPTTRSGSRPRATTPRPRSRECSTASPTVPGHAHDRGLQPPTCLVDGANGIEVDWHGAVYPDVRRKPDITELAFAWLDVVCCGRHPQ